MTNASELNDIISMYVKHGWLLRRALLSEAVRRSVLIPENILSAANVIDSDIDALWFSRPPKTGGVPWEIRHLSSNPYALLFTIDEFDEGFQNSLSAAEEVLRTNVSTRKEA
jgi:hypothetical protein